MEPTAKFILPGLALAAAANPFTSDTPNLLLTAMEMTQSEQAGMVLGAWGAVQATASGLAMALGGVARDVVGQMATQGRLGEVLVSDVTGYNFVFQTEMVMMFVVLVALGPLVSRRPTLTPRSAGLGLAELPG